MVVCVLSKCPRFSIPGELLLYDVLKGKQPMNILVSWQQNDTIKTCNCRMASVISKTGFLFLEQGFHEILVPICILISICCSATGFYYQVA